ncbi:MAG: N-acetylmuramoyl-L-alanine amidase [Chthoniobacterales bacterium]
MREISFKSVALACAIFAFLGANLHAETRTIVLDPGHGGHDRGGVPRQRVGEKALTLDLAQRLKKVLESSGYRVILTRNSDVFIPLGQRTAIANSYRGATFVSVHFNSASRSGANGIETYYYRSDSASLAANIHRHVVSGVPYENRGIRRRGYFVLRRTKIPGVLVECGFLTNPSEANSALKSDYRQRLAELIARGIRRVPPPPTRPLAAGSRVSWEVLPQQLAGPDFVRAIPRPKRYASRSKSSRKKSSSSRRKASSKKKSSSATKKSSSKKAASED